MRVLSIDGGGMRGLYSAEYLASLSRIFADKRSVNRLDIGKGFHLIAGASTGAIIACALAVGLDIQEIAHLYKKHGTKIFPKKLSRKNLFCPRSKYLKRGTNALKRVLTEKLGRQTLEEVWDSRQIALAIPAIDMSNHQGWVFKTPHLKETHGRDNRYSLVDVCLGATAAPIYRSLARVKNPGQDGHRVFADGGLWANNPILIALIDALEMTCPGDRIEIFCLGTCPRSVGEQVRERDIHGGLLRWNFGGKIMPLALDAQEYVFNHMAKMLSKHVERDVHIIRFPGNPAPVATMQYLDLDETRAKAAEALASQAQTDVNETLSKMGDKNDEEGLLLSHLLESLPPIQSTPQSKGDSHV